MINKTSDNLRVGNQRIVGLVPDKYYMVEILDREGEVIIEEEGEDPPRYMFVGKDGKLVGVEEINLNDNDNEAIINLENTFKNISYTVYSASPYVDRSITYYHKDAPTLPQSGPSAGPNGLKIQEWAWFLDLDNFVGAAFNKDRFRIVKIPVIPSNEIEIVESITTLGTSNRIILEGEGTTTDYLIIEYNNNGGIANNGFRAVRIIIDGTLSDEEDDEDESIVTIDISFNITDGTPTFTINPANQFPIEIPQDYLVNKPSDIEIISVSIINPSDFDYIKWLSNDEVFLTDEDTFNLKEHLLGNEKYWLVGTHIFTLEAKHIKNDSFYSASFTVAVT